MKSVNTCHSHVILQIINFDVKLDNIYSEFLERQARKKQYKINGLLDPIVVLHRHKIYKYIFLDRYLGRH